jgi:hypothetical protein
MCHKRHGGPSRQASINGDIAKEVIPVPPPSGRVRIALSSARSSGVRTGDEAIHAPEAATMDRR